MTRYSMRLVAHRGYMERYPENSWRGIQAAIDSGAVWIEFDIQMYKPGQFFLLHDANFQRTANSPLSLFDITEPQLNHISIHEPERLGETFRPEPICPLEEALTRLSHYPLVHTMVEIKEESLDHWGLEPVMQSLLPVLDRFKAQCVLISFSIDALRYAKHHSNLATGWVLRNYDQTSITQALELNPQYLICNHTKLPRDDPPAAGPWGWMLYDITDPDQAVHWMQQGIDLIETRDIGNLIARSGTTD
jgi:glycerophosphoryl diester phosphodiesterase